MSSPTSSPLSSDPCCCWWWSAVCCWSSTLSLTLCLDELRPLLFRWRLVSAQCSPHLLDQPGRTLDQTKVKSGQSKSISRQPTVFFFFFSAPLLCWQPMHACPTDTGNGRISSSRILHSFIHSFTHSLTHFIHRFSEACHTDCQLATAFSAQLDTALLSWKVYCVLVPMLRKLGR